MGHKTCTKCRVEKPAAEFYANRQNRDGLHAYCKVCNNAARTEWHRNNPERVAEWKRREKRPADRNLRERHRMTFEDRRTMWLMQGGRCAVCSTATPGEAGMSVDHDHDAPCGCGPDRTCPQCRRGLLCGPCNRMLGLAYDDPHTLRAGASYLERY